MALTVHIETVAATRTVAGIGRFAVSVEPEPAGRFPFRPNADAIRFGLCGGALLLAGVLAVEILPWSASARSVAPDPVPVAVDPVPAAPLPPLPHWLDVNRPIHLFDLTGSDLARLPLTYRARRLSDGSARRDTLVYGAFGTETPTLALTVLRLGREPDATRFIVDVERVAADQSVSIVRSGLPSMVATRFGPFEAADLTVARGLATQPCLGFRLSVPDDAAPAPVAMAGLACGTAAKPMDREGLACVLDRVDLLSAGEDTQLQGFFVDAERRRGQGCTGSRLLAAGSHPTWLDGEALLPPLKPSATAATKSATRRTSNAAEL